MKYQICPECRSKNTTIATGRFAGGGNQAFKNRICVDCRTAWRPACPRWVAIALIVLGLLVPKMQDAITKQSADLANATNAIGIKSAPADHSIWPYVVAGIAVTAGFSVLFGPAGKLKILGKSETVLK